MKWKIGIEIEHVKYAQFLSSEKSLNKMHLTTLKDYQTKADIKLYFFYKGNKTLIHSIRLQNLPQVHAGEVDITVQGEIRGRSLALTLFIGGKRQSEKIISLKDKIPFEFPMWILWSLLGVAGIILLLWLFLKLPDMLSANRGSSSYSEQTSSQAMEQERDNNTTSDRSNNSTSSNTGSTTEETSNEASSNANSSDTSNQSTNEPASSTSSNENSASSSDNNTSSNTSEETTQTETKEPIVTPIRLTEVIYFDSNDIELDSNDILLIDSFIRKLEGDTSGTLQINGHCADRGTEAGRESISEGRAQNVYNYLRSLGLNKSINLNVKSWEASKPATTDPSKEDLNRRVELIFDGEREEKTN